VFAPLYSFSIEILKFSDSMAFFLFIWQENQQSSTTVQSMSLVFLKA